MVRQRGNSHAIHRTDDSRFAEPDSDRNAYPKSLIHAVTQSDTNDFCIAISHRNTNTNTNTYAYSDSYSDADADADGYAEPDCNAGAFGNAYSHAASNGESDFNPDADPDSESHSGRNAYSDAASDGDSDSDADTEPDSESHSHRNAKCNCDPNSQRNANAHVKEGTWEGPWERASPESFTYAKPTWTDALIAPGAALVSSPTQRSATIRQQMQNKAFYRKQSTAAKV